MDDKLEIQNVLNKSYEIQVERHYLPEAIKIVYIINCNYNHAI